MSRFWSWLIPLAAPSVVRHLLIKEGGLTDAQADLMVPDVLKMAKDIGALLRKYKEMGVSDKGAVEAVAQQIVKPRVTWTAKEEQVWIDRDKATMG